MPLITVNIAEGRSEADIRKLMAALHTAAHESIGAPEPSIRVIVNEVATDRWLSGGQTLAEKAARS
ncbi:MAG: tautomerase family protein [Candidatus Microbacterium stercoravium]|uniref:tautomerase family protein n=1 Tax=Microbacterium sp. TaxID=51671 RepID=UPI003F9DAC11